MLKPDANSTVASHGAPARPAPHLCGLCGGAAVLGQLDASPADVAIAWSNAALAEARTRASSDGAMLLAAVDGPLASLAHGASAPSVSATFVPGERIGAGASLSLWDNDVAAILGVLVQAGDGVPDDRPIAEAGAALAAIRAEGLRHVTPILRHAEPWHERVWPLVVAEDGEASPDFAVAVLERALSSTPAADILAVTSSARGGPFAGAARAAGATTVHERDLPAAVLREAGEVWSVAGGAIGWDTLVHGGRPRMFRKAFYGPAGTEPDAGGVRAPDDVLESLFAAVALLRTNFADPVSGQPFGVMDAIDRLVSWRAKVASRPRRVVCVRFDHWKWPIARGFFGDGSGNVAFASARRAPALARRNDAAIYVWGSGTADRVRRAVAEREDGAGTSPGAPPVAQIEDGFIRSVGLGSDFRWPASYAIDDVGIYYDARQPSRLESILQDADFDEATLARARALRALIRERGISKYNIDAAHGAAELPALPADRRKLLVVGQVPTDASLAHGMAMFGGDNLPFLAAVRRAEPDAFVIYKEHPELVRRNRPGWLTKRDVEAYADVFLQSGDTTSVIGRVDHVHTMTSLAGFEALLHGARVTCWGVPFYAGWGLTEDKVAVSRRTRRRSLDELVAAALIRYPIYVDPLTGIPCEVEDIARLIGADPRRRTGDVSRAQGWPLATRSFAGLMRLRVLAFTFAEHPFVLARRARLVQRSEAPARTDQ